MQWAGRYATYSGSSPYRAPATLACIPHIEQRYGCWYPMGGLDAVREAMERAAVALGVRIRTGCEVVRIATTGDSVSGVELADGDAVHAPLVVADVDAEHLYGDLLDDDRALRRARRAPRSTSGLILLVVARGATPGLGHHNIWFSGDDRAEFAAVVAGRMADDPTIYACVSSVTDASQAAPGTENWFLLVNTPPGIRLDAVAEQRQRPRRPRPPRRRPARPGGVERCHHAAAVGSADRRAWRGHLRHVVRRSPRRLPASRQPGRP